MIIIIKKTLNLQSWEWAFCTELFFLISNIYYSGKGKHFPSQLWCPFKDISAYEFMFISAYMLMRLFFLDEVTVTRYVINLTPVLPSHNRHKE